jgi:ubiquinone/menaquinone biosynthesis C-methylase UbiE
MLRSHLRGNVVAGPANFVGASPKRVGGSPTNDSPHNTHPVDRNARVRSKRDGYSCISQYDRHLSGLLPLLECPFCHSCEGLDIIDGAAKTDIPIELCDRHLLCRSCRAPFPITDDFIPIIWDEDLQQAYTRINSPDAFACSAVDANVRTYDAISDDYDRFARRKSAHERRIRQAVRRALDLRREIPDTSTEPSQVVQLDYGCGPGHVIGWLKDFEFVQIGMDVSLANLRQARKHTGCRVVCGNASNMPFSDGTIDLITESSALHHIADWRSTIRESIRICKPLGGIVIDSEPSKDQMALSALAVAVFNARFPIYKALSYVSRRMYLFRDSEQAKLNMLAEIHHQPGTGFPLDEVEALFAEAGFRIDIIRSPTPELSSQANPNWKSILLGILSARNPWNPKYGSYSAIAARTANRTG